MSAPLDLDFLELNQVLAALMVRETALSLILEGETGPVRETIELARAQTSRAKAKAVIALMGDPSLADGDFYAGMPEVRYPVPANPIYEGMD